MEKKSLENNHHAVPHVKMSYQAKLKKPLISFVIFGALRTLHAFVSYQEYCFIETKFVSWGHRDSKQSRLKPMVDITGSTNPTGPLIAQAPRSSATSQPFNAGDFFSKLQDVSLDPGYISNVFTQLEPKDVANLANFIRERGVPATDNQFYANIAGALSGEDLAFFATVLADTAFDGNFSKDLPQRLTSNAAIEALTSQINQLSSEEKKTTYIDEISKVLDDNKINDRNFGDKQKWVYLKLSQSIAQIIPHINVADATPALKAFKTLKENNQLEVVFKSALVTRRPAVAANAPPGKQPSTLLYTGEFEELLNTAVDAAPDPALRRAILNSAQSAYAQEAKQVVLSDPKAPQRINRLLEQLREPRNAPKPPNP